MIPTILVAGTWANGRGAPQDSWWRPESDFYKEGLAHGLNLVDAADPFVWCTGLDGIDAENSHWKSAAHALIWYCDSKKLDSVNLLAHSHGGNCALYASNFGLKINILITVATPPRKEIIAHRANIKHWVHIRGGIKDYVQIAGELSFEAMETAILLHDFDFLERDMELADQNIVVLDKGHSELHEAALWKEKGWFDLLK